ncbi:hypothetical protein MNEG_2415 [Monoraphidium neglectum]|uniref:Uncharacterized protein n=1 Tax=Monoraphidium neglectum TaxID=145388 RepID=A0A0D2NLD9_9CHLO|nr:hypothetical protein MNEG_2415 [Monoraphidium neglectum]KIZ05546.1 hypothetical protein MNEG_2415 [Monoraphidium neglectum]|eukprot:XP_013904565.1 hypothetical protein MNEG_2415 [Monoraphidium neglectum]
MPAMPATRKAFLTPSIAGSMPQARRRTVQAAGLGAAAAGVAAKVGGAAVTWWQAVGWWPWWALLGVIAAGILLGLFVSKIATDTLRKDFDPNRTSIENRQLREKVEELQQLMVKLEPLAYKGMRLRFTKGINKAVILGMVDQMLANKEVNIWWLPDEVERIIYFNM